MDSAVTLTKERKKEGKATEATEHTEGRTAKNTPMLKMHTNEGFEVGDNCKYSFAASQIWIEFFVSRWAL